MLVAEPIDKAACSVRMRWRIFAEKFCSLRAESRSIAPSVDDLGRGAPFAYADSGGAARVVAQPLIDCFQAGGVFRVNAYLDSHGGPAMARLLFAFAVILLFDSFAQAADSYCWIAGGATLYDGQTINEKLKVVVSSVDRPHIPGRPGPRPWCMEQRRSLGGHSSSKIVEGPKLGQVHTNGYRVSYRGDRVGQDRFVIEHRWLNGSSNEWSTGRIIYEVEVLAQPM
jgi:hypothetical protein